MDAVAPLTDLMSDDLKNRVARIVRHAGQGLMRFIRARVASELKPWSALADDV